MPIEDLLSKRLSQENKKGNINALISKRFTMPLNIDVYKGQENYGFSDINKYDEGLIPYSSQINTRAANQSALEQSFNILTRGVTTFGTATAETIALPFSAIYALGAEGNFSDNLFRNSLIRGIDNIKKDIFDNRNLYLTEEQQKDTNFLDYLTTPVKVADDLVQGIGFLASMLVPTNWIGSAFSKGAKLSRWLEESQLAKAGLKGFGKLDDLAKEKLLAQGIDPIQFEAKLASTQKILEKTGVLTGALVGRLGESAMEANQSYEEIKNKLIEQGYSEEEATKQAREQSNNVFGYNMALAIPDAFQYMTVFKNMTGLGKLLGAGESKIDDAAKLINREANAAFAVKPLSTTRKVANKLWGISKTAAIESEEEGLQNTFQLAAMENALDIADGKQVDNYLSDILNQYSNSWTTIEGQKARFLGALLGAGGHAVGSFGENRKTEALAKQIVGTEEYTEEPEQQTTLNQQFLQKDKIDPTKRFTVLEDGTIKINEQYLRTLNNYTNIEEKKAIAQQLGDKVNYDRLSDLQLLNQTVAYAQAGKIDELLDTYKYLSTAKREEVEEFTGQKLVDENNKPIEPRDIIEPKIKRIEQINKLFDDINNDPVLAQLSTDAKRVITYKLAIFDNNKNEINKLNQQLSILKGKNAEAIANSYLTEVENTDNLTELQKKEIEDNKENKWRGLNGIEQEKAIKLENNLKALSKENKDILTQYSNIREQIKEFENEVENLNKTKDAEKAENTVAQQQEEIKDAELSPEQKAIKARKTQLENKLKVKQSRVEKGKKYISDLQETLLNLEIEAEELVKNNTGKKLSTKQLNKLNKALVELKNQIAETEAKIAEGEKLLTQLYNEIAELENTLDSETLNNFDIDSLKFELMLKKEEHENLARQLANDYSLLGNLKSLYNKLKYIWTKFYPNKKENLAKGRHKYEEAKEELALSKKDVDNLQAVIKEAEEVKSKLENEIKLLEQEIDEYNRLLGEETIEAKQKTNQEKKQSNSENINNPETQESTKDDLVIWDDYSKKLIDFVGFGTTYGSFFDYQNDNDDKVTNDISQRRWFSFTENMDSKKQHRLMFVSINHPIYGLNKEKSIYDSTNPKDSNADNIKVIVCDKNGNPITWLGGIVYTSIGLPITTDTKGNERFAFGNKKLNAEQQAKVIEDAKQEHIAFRNKILNNPDKTYYVDVTGISHGIAQTESVNKTTGFSVVGRLVQKVQDVINLQINIVKSKDKQGKVETPDGKSVSVSNGLPYVIYKGRIVPLITRHLNNREVTTALELVKAYVENYKDNKNKLKGLEDVKITDILQSFVFMSNKDSEFKFYLNKDSLQFGTKTITAEELLSGRYDSEIKVFLSNKTHQVNSSKLNNKNTYKQYYVVIDENGQRKIKAKEWANYNAYLFLPFSEDEEAPLTTNLKQNFVDNESLSDEDKLQNLQFANSYITFNNTVDALSDIKQGFIKKDESSVTDNNQTFDLTADKISFLPDGTEVQYDASESLSFTFKKEGDTITDIKVIKNTKNFHQSIVDAFFSKIAFDNRNKTPLAGKFHIIKNISNKVEPVKPSEIQAKKAEIEKRRREELNKGSLPNVPDYIKEEIDRNVKTNQNLLQKVRELAYQNKTKVEIAKELNVDKEIINSLRTYLQIPSMDSKTEFQEWKDKIDKINAKYDAELKAVESLLSKEQPTNQSEQKQEVINKLRDVESTGKALEDIKNKELNSKEGNISTGNIEVVKDIPIVNKIIGKDKNGNDIKVVINGDKLKGTLLSKGGNYLFKAMQGRVFTLAKVGDFYLPFYISSAGTSGKIAGEWYPFFGYNNWLVKGRVGTKGEMEYSQKISDVQKLLNENFVLPTKYLAADNKVAIGEQFVPAKDENGNIIREGKYNFEKMIPNENRKVLYDLSKDIDIITHHHQEQKGETKLNEHDWVAEKTGFNPKNVVNDGGNSADNWINDIIALTENAGLASKGVIKSTKAVESLLSKEQVTELLIKNEETPLDKEQLQKDINEANEFFKGVDVDEINKLLEEDEDDNLNRQVKENEQPLDEKEIEHVKSLLPKEVNYLTIKGLIDSKTIGRVLENGTILLSDLATEGTAYHEAYHIVSLFVLSNTERLALYNQYRKRTGKTELTNKQVEEELAEEFRDYMLSDGTTKIPQEQKSIFQKIVDFIKALLGMPNTSIEEVFNKISSGQYKNSKLNLYKLNEAFNRDANIDLTNPNDLKELMEGMTYDFFNILFKNKANLVELFTGKIKPQSLYAAMYAIYKQQANTSIGKAYLSSSLPLFYQAVQKHMNYLNSFGIKIYNINEEQDENTPYEDTIPEENKSKDSLGIDLAVESSTKDGMSRLTKYLIASLKAYKKKNNPTDNDIPIINSMGMPINVEFDDTLNYLQNKLAGKTDFKSMVQTIEQLALTNPTYKDLLNKLKTSGLITTPLSLTSLQVDLQTAFFQQFSKTKHTYITTLFDDEKGIILFVDSNKRQLRERIKNKWQANLKSNIFSKYLKNVDGILYLNTDELKKIDTDRKTNKDNHAGKREFLKAVGIDLLNFNNINWAEIGFEKIKEDILSSKTITDLFGDNIKSKNRLNKLVDAQIENTDEIPELQHINQENKTVYSITLNHFLSLVVNKLNENNVPDFLQPLNKSGEVINTYTVNSRILEHIKKEGQINIEVLEGIDYDGTGKATSENTQGDRLLQSFFAVLNGKFPIIRTSDKKMEFALSLSKDNKPYYFITGSGKTANEVIKETTEQFKLYLLDELNTINDAQGYYEYYNKKDTNLSIFDDIIPKQKHDSLIDGQLTPDEVSQDIDNYIRRKMEENLLLLQEYNIVTKVDENNYKFNDLLKDVIKKLTNKESLIINKEDTDKLMSVFTTNSLIANIEQSKIFFGNFNFYKNLTDLFKRTSEIVGTKKIARVDSDFNNWLNENFKRADGKQQDGTIRTIVSTDPLGIEELDSYDDGYEEPDAQGYITLDEYRELLKRTSDWTEEQEQLYQHLVNDKELPKNNKAIFNPLKPQYFGNQINNIGFVPTFYKFSLFPIHPKLLPEGSKLTDLSNKMQEKQIGIMLFATGNKVGRKVNNKGKGQEFYDSKGEIADLQENLIQTIDYNYFGIQVDNKGYKNKIVTGSQVRAIVQTNLYSEGRAINPKAERLINELDEVINQLTDISKEDLLKELAIEKTKDGLNYKIKDLSKFRKFLIEQSKSRQVPDNIIVGIQEVLKETNRNNYFEVLVNKNKIENLLFSLINNNIIAQKTFGNMAVQVASTGFETKNRELKKGRSQKDDVWAKSQDSLKFYRKEDGSIKEMEVFLPYYFKDYFGDVDITKIDPKLLRIVGFRIPTEQLNSIDVIKIKGFLPKESGNVIVVPSGIVKKSGSDFDIDKLNLFFPNYTIESVNFKDSLYFKSLDKTYQKALNDLSDEDYNSFIEELNQFSVSTGKGFKGDLSESEEYKNWSEPQRKMADEVKLSLVQFNNFVKKNNLSELKYIKYDKNNPTKEGLQNRMIELFSDILLMPENFKALVEPNSIQELQDLKNKISGTVKETSFTRAIEWKYISDIADQYWKGKALVGLFALQNKNHILTQKVNLQVNTDIYFKGFEDKETHSLGKVYAVNENGKDTKEIISKTNGQLVSTVVDVAKNPDVLTGLNINFDTANTISYLIRLGIPKETVFYFINQPIIKQYLNDVEKTNKARFLKANDRVLSLPKIQKKYLKEYNGNNNYLSLENLKSNINNSVDLNNQFQLQVLSNFLSYKEEAQKLSNLITSFNQDTLGVGKNRNELRIIKYKIDKALSNIDNFFVNQEKLVYNTFLRQFQEAVLDTEDFYKDLFLTNKTKFNSIMTSLLDDFNNRTDLKQDDIVKLLDIAEADLINYCLQSVGTDKLNSEVNKLFKSVDSLPRRFNEYLKSNPNSVLAREFVPIFNRESGIDNLKLFTKRLNYWESNNLTNALSDLKGTNPTLYNDLIKFSILQSGLNQSPISFTQIIPNEDFVKISSNILSMADRFDIPLQDFKEQFYKNNWNNSKLVPKEPAFKQDRQSGQYYKQNKDYIFVPKFKGELPYVRININTGTKENPKWETWLYERTENEGEKYTKYIRTNKFGDGMYLKEFGLDSSNIANNNYKFTDKTEITKQILPTPTVTKKKDIVINSSKKINIYAGTGENTELSNFAIRPFIIQGDEYQSVEQYYQYQKWNYLKEDVTEAQFKEDQKIADAIMNTSNGATLKSLGRKFKNLDTQSWDKNASKEMKIALKLSFEQNPNALQKLLATGNAELTHTQDKGKWGKEFPKLLMEVRNELNNQTNLDFNNDSSESFDEC